MSDTQATERDDASAAETTETVETPETLETAVASATAAAPATGAEVTAGDAGVDEAQPSVESVDDTRSGDDEQSADEASSALPATKGEKGSRVRQLEREGEVAADFLESLLDIADLDGDIDVDVDGDRAAIAIVDSDEGRVPRRLVGTDGKVLEALQELTRLAVQAETGERSRLMLDIAGHRAERRSALVQLAQAAIAEVKESGAKRSLEPMSAFERKVVHDEVAAAGLVSESEGVDPNRHIVILPA
ncbi:R3H domain-containing nucleic acid-binding protein [Terrabacter sp. NPDC000476]|uniref:Jag family protein n=1 Tax=Terrabacter sp. NPDC000476 TaxID=3154258 RepID=UPI00331B9142